MPIPPVLVTDPARKPPGYLTTSIAVATPPVSGLGRAPDLGISASVGPAATVFASSNPKLGCDKTVLDPVVTRVQAPPIGPVYDAGVD